MYQVKIKFESRPFQLEPSQILSESRINEIIKLIYNFNVIKEVAHKKHREDKKVIQKV